jgi:hypothetical protein
VVVELPAVAVPALFDPHLLRHQLLAAPVSSASSRQALCCHRPAGTWEQSTAVMLLQNIWPSTTSCGVTAAPAQHFGLQDCNPNSSKVIIIRLLLLLLLLLLEEL